MKRSGAGARDGSAKDRYPGKRQPGAGRGGRRQKSGSRDVSPAPPTWSSSQQNPATTGAHPPSLSPHQLAMLQQQLSETVGKTPLNELIQQIKKLTFPASCNFVLSLLEKFVKAHLTGDAMLKISLPKKIPLLALVGYFILCQSVQVKVAGKKNKVDQKPQLYSPLEELQVMVSVVKKIEEQTSIEQQFYMFEAIFGTCIGTIKTGSRAGESLFERVVCLAVSLQSSSVLSCVAIWMQVHSSEALSLSNSLYSCFCEHLPDASDPLVQVASLSPLLAQQLATSFTILHPFHIVGTPVPGVDPASLSPPKRLVSILSNWVEMNPQFLYPPRLLDKTDLIIFHGPSKVTASSQPPSSMSIPLSQSPLPGLISWCVLAPCYHHTSGPTTSEKIYHKSLLKKTVPESEISNGTSSSTITTERDRLVKEEEKKKERNDESKVDDETIIDYRTLVAKLHANLLSVVLSDAQSFPRDTLTSDHIAVTVAALLGLSHHQPAQLLKKRGGKGAAASATEEKRQEGDKIDDGLEESVERLAQFLQIGLSTGLLVLSSENLSAMASTLPVNKLLSLVISHHSRR